MPKFCDKCGHELRNHNAKFCDKCGAKLKVSTNTNPPIMTEEKNMAIALIISFFFTGLGIAYAGNTKNGIIIFAIALFVSFFNLIFYAGFIFSLISIILWIAGMILTYEEVNKINEIH